MMAVNAFVIITRILSTAILLNGEIFYNENV